MHRTISVKTYFVNLFVAKLNNFKITRRVCANRCSYLKQVPVSFDFAIKKQNCQTDDHGSTVSWKQFTLIRSSDKLTETDFRMHCTIIKEQSGLFSELFWMFNEKATVLSTYETEMESKQENAHTQSFELFSHLWNRNPAQKSVLKRSFSCRQDEDDDERKKRLRLHGAVWYIPNPFKWIAYKWKITVLRRKFDPVFSEDEFLQGAKQAVSCITELVSEEKFKLLTGLVDEEVVEWLSDYLSVLSCEEREALALKMTDIVLMKIRSMELFIETGTVYVDTVCFGLKTAGKSPYLIDLGVRFKREYTNEPSSWIVAGITHVRIQNLHP